MKELLAILRCPETLQELRLAAPDLLARLNRQIAAGTVKNQAGRPVTQALEAGLVRADGKILYPIRGNIPQMLIDEGLAIQELAPP